MNCENIILSALYSSDGNIFARVYEYQGIIADTKIQIGKNDAEIFEVDLDGNIKGEIKEPVRILPWQIRTFMINSLIGNWGTDN
jgi:hypothetical protein